MLLEVNMVGVAWNSIVPVVSVVNISLIRILTPDGESYDKDEDEQVYELSSYNITSYLFCSRDVLGKIYSLLVG